MFIPVATAMRTTIAIPPVGEVIDPIIVTSTYVDSTQSLDVTVTEENPDRLYWALVTNPSTPSAAQIVAGTGGGILEAGNVSYSGGFSGTISVTNEAGNELHLVATDLSGNQSTVDIVTGVTVDDTLPTADSAVTDVAGNTITLTTSETVSGNPDTNDFSFAGITAGTPTISSVTVSGTSIVIELSSNFVVEGDTVTVSYTKGGINVITDNYNNELATFASLAVTNNVPAAATINLVDETGVDLLDENNVELFTEADALRDETSVELLDEGNVELLPE